MELSEKLRKMFLDKIEVNDLGNGKYAIIFPMFKKDKKPYEIYLIEKGDGYILSDEGSTMKELEKIFFIHEPEVIRNLAMIAKQYEVKREGNNIYIECTPKDIQIKIGYLIQALSFMLNMNIFYI